MVQNHAGSPSRVVPYCLAMPKTSPALEPSTLTTITLVSHVLSGYILAAVHHSASFCHTPISTKPLPQPHGRHCLRNGPNLFAECYNLASTNTSIEFLAYFPTSHSKQPD